MSSSVYSPSNSLTHPSEVFSPSLAFSSLIGKGLKKNRRKHSKARRSATRASSNFKKPFPSEYKPPELKAYSEYVGCWHQPEDKHTLSCVSTVYKIDVRLPVPPVSAFEEGLVLGPPQPQCVTHSFTFKKDLSKGEPEYVEEYGPLVWTKLSWEMFPESSSNGGSKKPEDPQGKFKNCGFADPVKWVKKGKRFRNPLAQESPESPRPTAHGWRKTLLNTTLKSPEKSWWGRTLLNTRLNSPAKSWSDWLKGEPLPVMDCLGREVTPWPHPDEAEVLCEAGGC